ncbi:reverse transcriptase domain-containing protein [Tanacetum coccineum]
MEEMVYKFIDEEKREHKEMRAFIREFRTSNQLLFKERNNSLSERSLEKSIQSDLESYNYIGNKSNENFDSELPIRHIDSVNTLYFDAQKTTGSDGVNSEHLYSASANEIDEKKPELKDLPNHLEYAYLHDTQRGGEGAIAWKMSNIKRISLSFYTHKILMEDDFKPVIQPQRRLNPKVQDVVKNEIVKLLDSGLIYPISDSSWVSPIHVVPKKGITIDLNDNNELIPSRIIIGWRDFFEILITPKDQEKTMFTCPYGTFAYRRMPFGLCNTPTTFQRYMMAIFNDMVKDFMEVFMDDFLVFGNSFNRCLANLDRMLVRCEETNLVLNWEKCHFMVKEGIVLGHKIFGTRIKVDRAKIDVIAKLPYPTNVKGQKGAENLAADHLSRLENPDLGVFTKKEIADEFLDEHLMILKAKLNDDEPWLCPYNIMSQCVVGSEIFEILAHCHSGPTEGHHSASITRRKRSGNISLRSEMPQNNIQVEAQSLPTNDARVVIKFLRGLFGRFGVPKALISDRGTHFCNFQLEKALRKYGVTHKLSTTYHPQTNGQNEVTSKAIKCILGRSVGYNPKDWSKNLNDALEAFRTAYKTPTGCIPFRLVYGKACHLPMEIEHKAY